MSKTKQVIKNIITGGFEVVKDSAKQLGKTVSPAGFIEQALGTKSGPPAGEAGDEFTDYLKNLGDPNLTGANLEKKKKEVSEKEEEEKKKLRTFLQATPPHMRPREKQAAPRPHEEVVQEEERKKAMQIEQMKSQPQPLMQPSVKQPQGMSGARRRPKSADFEAGKNIKVG